MSLARLHRRLLLLMALAALGALAAGAGVTPWTVGTAVALVLGLLWLPGGRFGRWLEWCTRLLAVALLARLLHVVLVTGGASLPHSLAVVHVLLVGEALRPLDARNDLRLFALPLALLLAATSYRPGLGFGLAFAAALLLAALALTVGHLRRAGERAGAVDPRIGVPALALPAALSAAVLVFSVAVFVVVPRPARSWSAQRPAAQSLAGFSDEVSLAEFGGEIQSNPEVVFRVEFAGDARPATGELYWRGTSFDHFDGARWSRSWRALGRGAPPPAMGQAGWGGELLEYRIYGGPPGVHVLFGLHPVVRVRPRSAIRPRWLRNGDLHFSGPGVPVYTVVSGPRRPPEALLRAAPDLAPAPQHAHYLQLPRLDPRVRRLADSLTHAHPARIDRVRAVERWLREEFSYTLAQPVSPREATLEHFLFARRAGHCEYFSTAMAVLLRAVGIPARNVNGFLGGEWNEQGGFLTVTSSAAHSWVEVWFEGLGWVPFDPTPPARREELARGRADAMLGPVLAWLDAAQFQWYQWVVAYDREKQLGLLSSLAERLPRLPAGGQAPELPSSPVPLAVVLGALAAALLLRRLTAQGREPLGEESRYYLALRGYYARAGFPAPAAEPPLAFLERLRRCGAPGVEQAAWIVERYLRARFAGEPLDAAGRAEMRSRLARVRSALRERSAAPAAR